MNTASEPGAHLRVAMLMWACAPDREGGAEKQCRRIAVELKRQGVEVLIVTSLPIADAPAREVWEGGAIVRLGQRVPLINRGIRWLRKRLARIPSKALLFWLELPLQRMARRCFLSEFRAWLRTDEARGVNVFHAHEAVWLSGLAVEAADAVGGVALGKASSNYPLRPVGYDVPERGRWAALRQRAAYIAPTEHLKNELMKKGIPEERTFVIPNGVMLPDVSPWNSEGAVLYVGNLSQGADYKAFDVLFDAWRRVCAQLPDARLSVLGGGEDAYWRSLVREWGCAENVQFCGYQPDPARFYRDARCFVLPSRAEGMSNALLEAQAWGLPCVVSDIPANRAVVEDGAHALIVPVGDAAALADALLRLAKDDSLCRRLGEAARQNAERRFDIRVAATQLAEVYRHLLMRRAQKGGVA